jgi:hypothetical protein
MAMVPRVVSAMFIPSADPALSGLSKMGYLSADVGQLSLKRSRFAHTVEHGVNALEVWVAVRALVNVENDY